MWPEKQGSWPWSTLGSIELFQQVRSTSSHKPTVDAAHAAPDLFNLSEYRVLDMVPSPAAGRDEFIETSMSEAACPACGVLTARVQQRVHDANFNSKVRVRWIQEAVGRCAAPLGGAVTFTEHTAHVPTPRRP